MLLTVVRSLWHTTFNNAMFKLQRLYLYRNVDLNLGRGVCDDLVTDEFLCMVVGCALGTDVSMSLDV